MKIRQGIHYKILTAVYQNIPQDFDDLYKIKNFKSDKTDNRMPLSYAPISSPIL